MAHDWMTNTEAAGRLREWRDATLESVCGINAGSIEWLLDLVGDVRFRVRPEDQNGVFSHAADVFAYDRAILALVGDTALAAEQLALAAIRWQQCRARVRALRSIRSQFLCERAEAATLEAQTQEAPCWKNWQSGDEEMYLADVSEWCASCQQRQAVNEQLKAESRRHGASMRAVMAMARRRAPLFLPFVEGA